MLKGLKQNNKRDIIPPISLENEYDYFSKLLKENRPHFKNEDQNKEISLTASPIRINPMVNKNICMSLKPDGQTL